MGRLDELLAQLSPRERLGLLVAAVLVLTSAVHMTVIEPLLARQSELTAALEQRRELHMWLTARSKEAQAYRSAAPAPAATRSATIGEVEESIAASALGQALTRLEPTDDGLDIEFKQADLAMVLRWIEAAEARLGYAPAEIDIRRTDTPGAADVMMNLVGTAP